MIKSSGPALEVKAMFIKLTEGVLSYLRKKEMEFALADLSDAALDDIGLTRADLARVSVQPEIARLETVGSIGSLFAMPFAPIAQAV